MAINFAEAAGQVRLLIADVDETRLVLTDDMIEGYLARYGVEPAGPVTPRAPITRAAADALDAIATSEALVGKVMRTADGISTDGAKVADALRRQAAALRAQADQEDATDDVNDGSAFEVAEFHPHSSSGPELASGWW